MSLETKVTLDRDINNAQTKSFGHENKIISLLTMASILMYFHISLFQFSVAIKHSPVIDITKMEIFISLNDLDRSEIFSLLKHSLLLIKQFSSLTLSSCTPPAL
jgi:hypothetical protein